MKKLLLISALVPLLLFGQTRKQRKALAAQKKADQQVIANLKMHNQFFQSKDLQAQFNSNNLATVEYISNEFKGIGLQPKGTNGYLQQFKVDEGKLIDGATFLKVNGTRLTVKQDYFPLPFSSSKQVTGMPAMALKEKGVPWFVDIKDWLEDDSNKSDSVIFNTVVQEAGRAAAKGATALFLYNSNSNNRTVPFNRKDKTSTVSIPVVFITPAGYKKYFTDDSQVLDIELNVAFKQVIRDAINVVGYIDKGAATNVVIATAYDKTTDSEFESMSSSDSSYATSGNISSAALLIELAKMLSTSKAKNNNYTFVAYTGCDSMSSTSRWLNNAATTAGANYIINLGKLARFDDNKTITLTLNENFAIWSDIIKTVENTNVEVTLDSTNMQATNKYPSNLQLPVLNFNVSNNTTTTADYSRLNYEGELNIAKYIYRLVEATDSRGKIPFPASNVSRDSQVKMAAPVSSSHP